jgi:hypothetical protein
MSAGWALAASSPVRAVPAPNDPPIETPVAELKPQGDMPVGAVPEDGAPEVGVPEVEAPEGAMAEEDTRRFDMPEEARDDVQKSEGPRRQRRDRLRAEREKRAEEMRRLMASFGFADRELQDTVLRYIDDEIRARSQVRREGAALLRLLRDKNLSEKEMDDGLMAYRNAMETERGRRALAENQLDERIRFRSQPRLEAMLTLFGVVGESSAPLSLRPRLSGQR